MATITGRAARSTLPAPTRRSVEQSGTPTASRAPPQRPPGVRSRPRSRVRRTSGSRRDGGRTYPARHARPLPAEPPGQPCTVPVYDPGSATGPDAGARPDVRPAATSTARPPSSASCSSASAARYVADVSPSGGRHVYVLFAAPLPWLELRDVARALALRFPAIDTAPMSVLGGQISPPGSPSQVRRLAGAVNAAGGRQGGRRAPERAGGMGRAAGRARGRAAPGRNRPPPTPHLPARGRAGRHRRPVGAPPRRPRSARRRARARRPHRAVGPVPLPGPQRGADGRPGRGRGPRLAAGRRPGRGRLRSLEGPGRAVRAALRARPDGTAPAAGMAKNHRRISGEENVRQWHTSDLSTRPPAERVGHPPRSTD